MNGAGLGCAVEWHDGATTISDRTGDRPGDGFTGVGQRPLFDPTLLLTGRARIEYWNEAAAALLARGDPLLVDHGGSLMASDGAQTERLWSAIASAASAATTRPLALTCRQSAERWRLLLAPIRSAARPAGPGGGLVLATLVPLGNPPDPATILQQRYRLTPAEARLALAVTRIQPLEAAASALGIGRETAKSHLRVVFGKLGLHRQAQLVAVVGEISRGGHPNGG